MSARPSFPFDIIRTPADIRSYSKKCKMRGEIVALVPTMGALHSGHLSLINLAKTHADKVIISIYVNPKQFGINEDFSSYPRQLEKDFQTLAPLNIDAVYCPDSSTIYGENFQTSITLDSLSRRLCGLSRPDFFPGVALIVTKLFMQSAPDIAIFGQKDYQQLTIIKKLVDDLDIAVKILPAPTMREKSGLAMSSRNVYLNTDEAKIAPLLFATMQGALLKIQQNDAQNIADILDNAKQQLLTAGFDMVDYFCYIHGDNLDEISEYQENGRIIAAAYLGKTRLIDNLAIDELPIKGA